MSTSKAAIASRSGSAAGLTMYWPYCPVTGCIFAQARSAAAARQRPEGSRAAVRAAGGLQVLDLLPGWCLLSWLGPADQVDASAGRATVRTILICSGVGGVERAAISGLDQRRRLCAGSQVVQVACPREYPSADIAIEAWRHGPDYQPEARDQPLGGQHLGRPAGAEGEEHVQAGARLQG